MKRKLYIYDSLTEGLFSGNQAGIVVPAEGLTEEEMKQVSKELGYSETAFVFKSENADTKVKFFTPTEEVDLCGHATIACITCLYENGYIDKKDVINMDTNLGVLPIYVNKNQDDTIKNLMMVQDQPQFRRIDDKVSLEEIMEAINLEKDSVDETIPVIAAYTGLWDIMLPLKTRQGLENAKLNREKMIEVSKKTDTISYHVYNLDIENKKVYARNFAPIVGIDEEAATGTSNAAMGAYLVDMGILEEKVIYTTEQGKQNERQGFISFMAEEKEGKLIPYVGGKAIKFLEGEIEI